MLPSATLTFSANEADATFQCSVDGSAFNTCTSPLELIDLAVGVHQLRVRAVDGNGNVDPTPAFRNWQVTPPPETTILTGPGLETESTTATFTFEADQPDATFECALDQDISFEPCASGVTYTGLVNGQAISMLTRLAGVEPGSSQLLRQCQHQCPGG